MKYIFILGRTPELSLAEIRSVFAAKKIQYEIIKTSREVAIIDALTDVDIEKLNKTLGGVVKIGVVAEEKEISDNYAEILSENILDSVPKNETSKIEFGISIYSLNGDRLLIDNLVKGKFEATKTIKNWFEQKGVKAHFPQSMDRFLSSAAVGKNKLIEKGAEILIIVGESKIYIGKTLAIQEFEQFSKRDYGRPERDMKSGMIPPKLARIMINLSGAKSDQTLLDPFCGSGTVLQEGLFLGFKNVFGTDTSEKAVEDTKTNLEWVSRKFRLPTDGARVELKDVRNISKIWEEMIDVIVTEPYLGPTLHQRAGVEEINKNKQTLERLYIDAFSEFKKVLKKGGAVVIIFPVFQGKRQIFMDVLDKIKGMGFQQADLSQTPRKSIIVGNRFDFVLREVLKFKI